MTVPEDLPPVRPAAPDPGDCCGEGCPHCVLDLYDAAIERYEAELEAWRARQSQSGANREIPTAG
ncbi:MAG: oxidoreductase-like domain-containing protein [Rudaea sp.]|nr:oxidoreductase-like domain-containing protein [Rudaea sp.]